MAMSHESACDLRGACVAANDSMVSHDRAGPSGPAAETTPATWPVASGEVPPLAEAFSSRPETGIGHLMDLRPGQTTVLTTPDPAPGEPVAALGGTGKTQLAVAAARSLWRSGDAELL